MRILRIRNLGFLVVQCSFVYRYKQLTGVWSSTKHCLKTELVISKKQWLSTVWFLSEVTSIVGLEGKYWQNFEASCNKLQVWWVWFCQPKLLSLTDKSLPCTVILLRVSSILFKSVFEFIPPEAVIWRPSMFPGTSLWSGSGRTLSTSRLKDALTDFISSSSLGSTKLSIAVSIAFSCTLVLTIIITTSTSLRSLSTRFSSSECISIGEVLTWVGFLK